MREPTPAPAPRKPRKPRKLKVTERQALQVVREIAWAFGADPFQMDKTSITVLRDYEETRPGPDHGRLTACAIVWEEGPDGWADYVPDGGDYGGLGMYQVPAIRVPEGVRVETRSGCSISLYREPGVGMSGMRTIDYADPKYSKYAGAMVKIDWTLEDVDPNGIDPATVTLETVDQIMARRCRNYCRDATKRTE